MPRIFLDRLTDGYLETITRGITSVLGSRPIAPGTRVAIKPNLTFPEYRRGVMTTPEAVEALIIYLKNFTDRIIVCESDSGGYNRFSMTEVFARTGIADFAKRHGVGVVNLSQEPSRVIQFRHGLRNLRVPLPTCLLDETDLFITMPVPKVHANAGVSISLKNQWGIIQEPAERLKLHPYFNEVIYRINKALPRSLSIVDGKYGLTRNGPMRGDDVELNWLLVGDSLFYVDGIVAELMGINWQDVPHLRHAFRKEGIDSMRTVETTTDLNGFKSSRFYLSREWTDIPGYLTFHSRLLAYIGYESVLAEPLHWLLYKFREPFY
ncbi:MAG TPA: DUF362 domain-containing protein [Candidatus Binatus sp.]|nr:DUF362 domain-containing protein [Candidatus Binatus sp.]